jgi:hypothetical protein
MYSMFAGRKRPEGVILGVKEMLGTISITVTIAKKI